MPQPTAKTRRYEVRTRCNGSGFLASSEYAPAPKAAFEKGLLYDNTLEAMHAQLELLLAADVEAKWRAARYTPVHSPHGRIWYPPDYPGLQRSGFEEGKPGEPQPEPVEVPPPEPTSEQGAARNLRNLEERIARLEALAKEEQK